MIAITCVDKNWAIGKDDKLLFHIPEDMKYFKRKTMGNIIVMGKNTWNSLPKRPLEGRINIVVSSKPDDVKDRNISVIVVSIEDLMPTLKKIDKTLEHTFIIGGEMLYKELINQCELALVTSVNTEAPEANKYFPNLDNMSNWVCLTENLNNKGKIVKVNKEDVLMKFHIYNNTNFK